jgi:hypothetical protein
VNPRLDIRCAKTDVFADGTGSALLESLKNSAAGRIGDSMQHAIQGLLGIRHDEIAINRGSMVVNMGVE